jgi:SAM-dependent methyltransferase
LDAGGDEESQDSMKRDNSRYSARVVLGQLIRRLIKDPAGTVKRGLYHAFIGRFKYARRADYDAQQFWQDRFERCGFSFESVTDEVHSEADNREREKAAKEKFLEYCRIQSVDLSSSRALEIGCGTGFYTRTLDESGVKEYTGIDITDALFAGLRERHPRFKFVKQDVTTEKILGSYDLIVMIDVIQHIVSDSKLRFAMQNIKGCLAENGVLIIAPLREITRTAPFLYFLRLWSLDDVIQHFEDCEMGQPISFRNGESIIAIKK